MTQYQNGSLVPSRTGCLAPIDVPEAPPEFEVEICQD